MASKCRGSLACPPTPTRCSQSTKESPANRSCAVCSSCPVFVVWPSTPRTSSSPRPTSVLFLQMKEELGERVSLRGAFKAEGTPSRELSGPWTCLGISAGRARTAAGPQGGAEAGGPSWLCCPSHAAPALGHCPGAPGVRLPGLPVGAHLGHVHPHRHGHPGALWHHPVPASLHRAGESSVLGPLLWAIGLAGQHGALQ